MLISFVSYSLKDSCRLFGLNGISPIDGAEDKQKHEAIARWLGETQLTQLTLA